MLIGSHNLLATPSRRQLDHEGLRPLLDEFLHGARGTGAEERAALFRLAWDFVGSSLAGRNVLYERFYLTSAARNRINHHLRNVDRSPLTRWSTRSWRPGASPPIAEGIPTGRLTRAPGRRRAAR